MKRASFGTRFAPALLCALFILGAIACRIVPAWPVLVQDGAPLITDNDALFHLRQAQYSLRHFPAVQRYEDVSRYPDWERNDAAGLYDVMLAGLGRLAAGGGIDERRLQWVCFFVPPLLFGLALALAALLIRRVVGPWTTVALTSGMLVLSGDTLSKTLAGICDHHVMELALGIAIILVWVRLLERETTAPAPWWRPAWGAALPLALLQFTWLGAPIYLLVLVITIWLQLVLQALAGADPHIPARAATRLLLALALMVGVVGLVWPDLQMRERYHGGVLAGALTLAAGFPLFALALDQLRQRWGARAAALLAIGATAGLAALVFATVPAARVLAGEVLAQKSLSVDEHVRVTWGQFWFVTGLPGLLALAAPAALAATDGWRRPLWIAASVPSLLLLALWWRTFDYGYLGALHALIAAAPVVALAGEALHARGSARLGAVALAAGAVAVAVMAWPLRLTAPIWPNRPWLERLAGFYHEGWRETAAWFRALPPPLSPVPGQRLPRGRAGVLTDWATGNNINTFGGWPAVNSRYPDAEGLRPLFTVGEVAAQAAPLRGSTMAEAVAYVVVDPRLLGDYLESHVLTLGLQPGNLLERRTLRLGSEQFNALAFNWRYRRSFATRLWVEDGNGLQHFRLVFESRTGAVLRSVYDPARDRLDRRSVLLLNNADRETWSARVAGAGIWREETGIGFDGVVTSAVKVFEQVAGATIVGPAPAGATVVAEIQLQTMPARRRFIHRQEATADPGGRFRLVLPYATEATARAAVGAAGPWQITAGGEKSSVSLTEKQVVEGETVTLPGGALAAIP